MPSVLTRRTSVNVEARREIQRNPDWYAGPIITEKCRFPHLEPIFHRGRFYVRYKSLNYERNFLINS